MNWEDYVVRFTEKARLQNHKQDYVARCLEYARNLYGEGFPIIYDINHLSLFVGYRAEYVIAAAYGEKAFYREFKVRKKSGGERTISEPLPSLKEIQRWILDHILYVHQPSRYAKGFVPKRSIKDNARFHRAQPKVLSLDLKDFFPTVKRYRVYGIFRSFGYSQPVSNLLARLCTLENVLPQGAPTSPAITNLICRSLDNRLAGFAIKHKLRYTRYADDITFSGEFRAGALVILVRKVVENEGFILNESKTRLMEPHQRQEVTGIVVNHHLQAPREMRRDLRKAIHYIERYGLNAHLFQIGETRRNYVKHLIGIANFVLHVNPKDRDALRALQILQPQIDEEDE